MLDTRLILRLDSDYHRALIHRVPKGKVQQFRDGPILRTDSRILYAGLAGKPGLGQFRCTFPVDQGFRSRDEFAIDCAHRHSVCGCGDFRRALPQSLRILRDSAGSWRLSQIGSEPETAASGRVPGGGPRSSLLAVRPVRFRSRFAYQELRRVPQHCPRGARCRARPN